MTDVFSFLGLPAMGTIYTFAAHIVKPAKGHLTYIINTCMITVVQRNGSRGIDHEELMRANTSSISEIDILPQNPDNFAATCLSCGNSTLNNAATQSFKVLGGFEPDIDDICIACNSCRSREIKVSEF